MTHEPNLKTYFREISVFPRLSREDEDAVAARMLRGDPMARQYLIRCHLKFAADVASKWARRNTAANLAELISEANVGLTRAADTFKPSPGYRFSTHANWHIRDALRRYVAATRGGIPLGPKAARAIRRYRDAEDVARQALGREPSFGEVCDALGLNAAQRREMAAKLAAAQPIRLSVSTQQEQHGHIGAETGQDVADHHPSALDSVEVADLLARMLAVMARMDDEDVEIIRRRFGIGFDRPQSRAEVARTVGYSEPTVAKIEASVMREVRDELVDG